MAGIDPGHEMDWKEYLWCLLGINALGLVVVLVIQLAQAHLPLNPQGHGSSTRKQYSQSDFRLKNLRIRKRLTFFRIRLDFFKLPIILCPTPNPACGRERGTQLLGRIAARRRALFGPSPSANLVGIEEDRLRNSSAG